MARSAIKVVAFPVAEMFKTKLGDFYQNAKNDEMFAFIFFKPLFSNAKSKAS